MSTASATKSAKLVEFGRGTDTVHYSQGCRSTGYGSPENPHAAAADKNIPDGVIAIDKRPAIDTQEGFAWVFRGPLVDVDLSSGKVSACPDLADSIVASAVRSDPGNVHGTMADLHDAVKKQTPNQPGPLDYVDIWAYVDGWRRVGARIGQYVGGEIVWEDQQ